MVSYDVIGQDVLNDIAKVEKRGLRKTILAFLEQDDDKNNIRRSPPPSLPPLASTPLASTPAAHSTNVSPSASTVVSLSSTPSPGGLPIKKNLRAGRKKVNITTTGDILPISNSPTDPLDIPSLSTVETLQNIMLELERKEAEATLRQQQQQQAAESVEKVKPWNRYFCCFCEPALELRTPSPRDD